MGRLKMQKTESMECIITEDSGASPSAEESNGDGKLARSGTLKKGPWTPEEDKILEAYVTKNGEGNWNAVQKYSGLSRCGKSCRLRWANHLRPNLKKGTFTPEEEDTIIRLHAKLGNKWARMANQLPGRTDNEIKNFWNTRIKRLQRAGQSIYPADVEQSRKSSETHLSQVSGIFSSEVPLSQNFKEAKFEIPPFEMADSFSYLMNRPGIPTSNMLAQNLLPSRGFSNPLSTSHPQKRLRESDSSLGLRDTATSSLFSQESGNAPEMYHHQLYELPDLPGSYHGVGNPSLSFLPGSHASINGICSTSDPDLGSVKLELPSFQSSELYSISGNFLPLEYNDTEVQFLQTEPCQVQSTHATDGLLESIVCQPERVKSPGIETNLLDDFIINPDIKREWSLHGDQDDSTLLSYGPVSGHTLGDEPQLTDNIITGHQANTSDADPHQRSPGNHVIEADWLDSSWPDALLNANHLSPDTEQGKQFLLYQEALSHLLEGPIYLPQPQPWQLEGFQGANSTVGAVVPSI